MANPLYDMLRHGEMTQHASQPPTPMFQNPMQKMNYILQAMRNPGRFVKQAFPDIPDAISGDPGQILQYLQQTRNISNEQIQQIASQIPRF